MADAKLVSLSHLLALQRAMDAIANNIANVSTPGFKRETVKFEEYIATEPPEGDEIGPQRVSYVRDAGSIRNLNQGHLNVTGATFDLAIQGDGYFVVRSANGDRYTRDGHFSLDAGGRLTTRSGNTVVGDSGEIFVGGEEGTIQIAPDGTVSGKSGVIGKIRIVGFGDERLLQHQGAGLLSTTQQTRPASGRILQGTLENSNVEPVIEIANMIEVMRAYQSSMGLVKSDEDAGELGRLGSVPKV